MKSKQELYKPQYTEEEVNSLTEWFEERMDRLPKTLRIDKATESKDLPRTVSSYIKLLRSIRMNVANSGYMAHLLFIREKLIEEGLE